MNSETYDNLKAQNLMRHMRVLCKEIGPRPPTSRKEHQASQYVIAVLQALGYQAIREHPFKSQNSYGWVLVPASLFATLGMSIARLGGQVGKLMGSILLLVGAHVFKDFTRGRPPFFQPAIARGNSQNLILDIDPTGETKQQVFLIGHLDTQKQRFLAPPPKPAWMKPLMSASILLPALSGVSLLMDVLFKRKGRAWWHKFLEIGLWGSLAGIILDEMQPQIEGASDNASAVSVLLGIAEVIRSAPLENTRVTLLFTGCEEPTCVGIESYLQDFCPPRETTYWIDVDMVGSGEVCYVTRHGISHLTEYVPDPEMVQLARDTARKHPHLRVKGKDLLILDEVSNLRDRLYRAILVSSYAPNGALANWHRLSDRLENIQPETLERAAYFVWAMLQEIDDQ